MMMTKMTTRDDDGRFLALLAALDFASSSTELLLETILEVDGCYFCDLLLHGHGHRRRRHHHPSRQTRRNHVVHRRPHPQPRRDFQFLLLLNSGLLLLLLLIPPLPFRVCFGSRFSLYIIIIGKVQ